jgi:DNA-binding Lrp family transcriptional regulator
MSPGLDNVDRGILHLLQVDARNTTAQEIADKIGVSASTVRNRIEQLEDAGVITGYHPKIDYEAANLPLQVLFIITAPADMRSDAVEKLLNVKGVVDIRETLTGHRNIHIEVVATSTPDVTRMTDAIHDLGLQIESSEIMKQRRTQPFNHFHYEGELGDDVTDEAEDSRSSE